MENELCRYAIVYLIKGKAKEYHKQLAGKIAETFGIFNVSNKIDAHLTLKYFENLLNKNQVKELEEILDKFCKSHRKVKMKLQGIGHFGDNFIFVDTIPSKEMSQLYKELVKELEKFDWVRWSKFDKENIHFHATLVTEDIKDRFEEIYKLASKENPNFDLDLDNICILKKPEKRWMLHREFFLK
jgi:2'-5' RNA ligase